MSVRNRRWMPALLAYVVVAAAVLVVMPGAWAHDVAVTFDWLTGWAR